MTAPSQLPTELQLTRVACEIVDNNLQVGPPRQYSKTKGLTRISVAADAQTRGLSPWAHGFGNDARVLTTGNHLLDEYEDTGEVGRPRREPQEPQFLDAEQAEELIARAREQGVGSCSVSTVCSSR
jgi:hypothetical protein